MGKCLDITKYTETCGALGVPVVTCPYTSLAADSSMQCEATGVLGNGSPATLTDAVTWSAVNNGSCADTAGTMSIGLFIAQTAGCKSDVSASYTAAGGTQIKSNVFTVTVTN
jgi:hypothetical protein